MTRPQQPQSPQQSAAYWQNPESRYYYGWYDTPQEPVPSRTDGDLKSEAVDRLRGNALTKSSTLEVNVQAGVVVLAGDIPTAVAKRAAGDDCWDIAGVLDVSNQLRVVIPTA